MPRPFRFYLKISDSGRCAGSGAQEGLCPAVQVLIDPSCDEAYQQSGDERSLPDAGQGAVEEEAQSGGRKGRGQVHGHFGLAEILVPGAGYGLDGAFTRQLKPELPGKPPSQDEPVGSR